MNPKFSRITLASLDAKAGQQGVARVKRGLVPKRVRLRTLDGKTRLVCADRTPEETTEAFWMRITIKGPDECWEWQGQRNKKGYGQVTLQSSESATSTTAQRIAFEMIFGYRPTQVMHMCDNPPCCNPRHLVPGTNSLNQIDSARKGRHGNVRLSLEQVQEIRLLKGTASRQVIGPRYGVHPVTISDIWQGRTWNH